MTSAPAAGSKVVIVGGGLGGALTAILLGRRGYGVELFERRPDPRRSGRSEGRSINLAISTRGFAGLERAGLEERIRAMSVPMRGRMIHGERGGLTFQPYGTERDQAIHSVSRAGLSMALLETAETIPGVRVVFGARCTGLDPDAARVELLHEETGEHAAAAGDFVIGADGAYSAVRARLARLDRFDYSQEYLGHGYKELVIPPDDGGGFRMEKNALHIWPRGGFMMIALPNADGSFTCTCFWPLEGENGFASLTNEREVLDYFGRVFPDAVPLMPTLAADYLKNPVSSLVTVRCRPWRHKDRVVLMGDAAHAVVPFYGQGANAAFEDCVVFDECIGRGGPDRERVFEEYERLRKEHVDALATLAVENFYEMRDKVASRAFLARKSLEKTLHRLFPWWFVPLYSMITFSRIPYADAVRRARRQARVIERIAWGSLAAAAAAILWIVVSR